ncbi:envelope-like protein, partial [Trifolium medium]|nr:envelope-like protein [Trifolium medium]
HVESYVVKLPIAFPCLITKIILSQHPTILHPEEVQSKKPLQLAFNYRLFAGTHVPDIVVSNRNDKDDAGTSAPLTKSTKDEVLSELIEVSKALGETIRTSTIRKIHVDNLIKSITKEQEAEVEKGDKE